MRYRRLVIDQRGPVAVVTLARPRLLNRVDLAMVQELQEVCQRLRRDDSVRVVVVTGRGRAFSCGAEPYWWGRETPETFHLLERYSAASALAGIEKPVIAAVNGDALDQGLELALACDVRIAAQGARLGLGHLAQGAIPWDGGTQRLARLVGRAQALEMLLTGRLLEAQEALRWGLVNQVVSQRRVLDEALALASRVAEQAPLAARYAKEAVLKGLDMTLGQGLRLEADLSILLQGTRDRAEGIRAWLEKRKPTFTGE